MKDDTAARGESAAGLFVKKSIKNNLFFFVFEKKYSMKGN